MKILESDQPIYDDKYSQSENETAQYSGKAAQSDSKVLSSSLSLLPENRVRLKRSSVWFANVDKPPVFGALTSRSHGFSVVGDPGKLRKSGAMYYSLSSDGKRGGVDIDSAFLSKINSKSGLLGYAGPFKFSDKVRDTVSQLSGKSYPSREAFHIAYEQARTKSDPSVSAETVRSEIKKLSFLVPASKMEIWPKDLSGYQSKDPTFAERDIRAFENASGTEQISGKDFKELSNEEKASGRILKLKNISIREISGVDPLALLEVKRGHILQRLYVDELHGRDGTGIPIEDSDEEGISAKTSRNLEKVVPTYSKFLLFASENEANCNSGAASMLRQALEMSPGSDSSTLKPASPLAFGFHHQIKTWNPVKHQAKQVDLPSKDTIDTTPIRGADIDVSELNKVLQSAIAQLTPPSLSEPGSGNHAFRKGKVK